MDKTEPQRFRHKIQSPDIINVELIIYARCIRACFAHEHFLKYCKMRERGFRKLPHNLFPHFKGCAMNYRMTYKNSNLEYIKTCFLSSFRKNL